MKCWDCNYELTKVGDTGREKKLKCPMCGSVFYAVYQPFIVRFLIAPIAIMAGLLVQGKYAVELLALEISVINIISVAIGSIILICGAFFVWGFGCVPWVYGGKR
ncbi:MAG: hypothetical protein AAB451_00595 [Patescibacteria group bacterium]